MPDETYEAVAFFESEVELMDGGGSGGFAGDLDFGGGDVCGFEAQSAVGGDAGVDTVETVSYTHLTLPTKRIV